MIMNLNARTLSDNSIYLNYDEGGKAKTASFRSWEDFSKWLRNKLEE